MEIRALLPETDRDCRLDFFHKIWISLGGFQGFKA